MKRVGLFSAIAALGLAAGTQGEVADGPWFEDVALDAGVDFVHVRAAEQRYWFPEIMSGGAAWLDYDDDGDPDLYLVQGGDLAEPGPGNRLFRNDGGQFVDVTDRADVGDRGYGMGVAVGDVNGDGAVDLYVTNVGPNVLYRNRGDGRFERSTSGAEGSSWSASAAFTDSDRDGDLDLFVVNYVHWSPGNEVECSSGGRRDYCHPSRYNAPAADDFYRNDGTGAFENRSAEAGIEAASGNGLGVAPLDFDGDGWVDLYVANDGMPNQLWINQGDGAFQDRALIAGCAVNRSGAAEAGMGIAVGDVDSDGAPDLLLTHLRDETNTLYLNQSGSCDDVSGRSGVAVPSIGRTGFGTAFEDFDLDGRLDLLVVNGRVGVTGRSHRADDVFAEPDQLLRGEAPARFVEVPTALAGQRVGNSRAAAVADFDLDGSPDVAIVDNGDRARLLRNLRSGAWSSWEVRGTSGAPVLGAFVRVETLADVWERRVDGAGSYCSAHLPVARFGLGRAIERLDTEVRLPSGRALRFLELPARRAISVRAGS